MAELIEAISIQDDDFITIKFESSLRRASISDERFKLLTADGTPSEIPNVFYPIDLDMDYNALTKILKLHLRPGVLEPGVDYTLRILGLQNALGTTLPAVNYNFTSDDVFEDNYVKPSDPEIIIEDHSIKDHVYVGTDAVEYQDFTTEDTSTRFGVRAVEPANNSVYLSEDENNGIIEITFSGRVLESQLTSNYFKTQRKLISRGPTRWETLNPQIEQNSADPIVYIKLPSIDSAPSYGVAGKTYFEPGYKYRVIVSRSVSLDAEEL